MSVKCLPFLSSSNVDQDLWHHIYGNELKLILSLLLVYNTCAVPGIILCMRPANEKRRYIVIFSLIGWVHTQNDPCNADELYLRKTSQLPQCKWSGPEGYGWIDLMNLLKWMT